MHFICVLIMIYSYEIANQNELDSEWVVQTPKQTNCEYYCDQKVHTSFIAAKNLITTTEWKCKCQGSKKCN